MANKRTPAETLFFLIGELENEDPDDRVRLIDAMIVWFEMGGLLATFGNAIATAERGDGRDG